MVPITSIPCWLMSYEFNLNPVFVVKCQLQLYYTACLCRNDAGPTARSRGVFSKKFRHHAFKARKGWSFGFSVMFHMFLYFVLHWEFTDIDSWPFHCSVMTLAMLFTHVFVTKEYNLVSGLRAVMPCGWEGNRVPGGEQWQPADGFIKSSLC